MDIGDIFRKATRPIVTIIFAAVLAQVVVERIDAPEWFIGLACGVILWWFGDRTARHIKDRSAGPGANRSAGSSSPAKGEEACSNG